MMAVIAGVLYYMYIKKRQGKRENFSITELTDKDIMPIYKDITAEAIINYFGGTENFTKILLEHDIPMSYISDPKEYPKIATFLNLKIGVLTSQVFQ